MRVLLIEDDVRSAGFIRRGLNETGISVDYAADGVEGLHLACGEPYDAAIVDMMLPGLDGLSLMEHLRRQKNTMPVIILSARRSVDGRVKGLETGGEDYLTKPFAFSEPAARLNAPVQDTH